MQRLVLIMLSLVFIGQSGLAQRCDVPVRSKQNTLTFENWLKNKQTQPKIKNKIQGTQQDDEVYYVPVVVHVVHNGEQEGEGVNISDEQILAQIEVINEDFRRLNADKENTPAEFESIATDTHIEFVMAKQDPEGIPTNGITRTLGTNTTWSRPSLPELKSLSYWPSEDYFNIWVTKLSGNLLGMAEFPETDLDGIDESQTDPLLDGIVISYHVFGSLLKGNFPVMDEEAYDRGRTTTHEVGHYLGLIHIWGDGGCEADDYCEDTPNAGSSYLYCPTPDQAFSCDSRDMFENYMDYSDDVCMNLFTLDQKARMRTVLENSPRRKSLLISVALEDPAPQVDLDLGIRSVMHPQVGQCDATVLPKINVRNYGINAISQARVAFRINNVIYETKDVQFDPPLNSFDTASITFNNAELTPLESQILQFELIQANNQTDDNAENNMLDQDTYVSVNRDLPYTENFEGVQPSYLIRNSDQQIGWTTASAPSNVIDNEALKMAFFDYANVNAVDYLLTPIFDFSKINDAKLYFDFAYAARNQLIGDQLIIKVSTDCGNTFSLQPLFNRSGTNLATAPSTEQSFVPEGSDDWEQVMIDLTDFTGYDQVQVAFMAKNANGNNLYLDNILIEVIENFGYDLVLHEIVSPEYAFCSQEPQLQFVVENIGVKDITAFDIQYQLNHGAINQQHIYAQLISEEKDTITVSNIGQLTSGDFKLTLANPNLLVDDDPTNNSLEKSIVYFNDKLEIPFREPFNITENEALDWTIINPDQDIGWELVNTFEENQVNIALQLNHFNYDQLDAKDYIYSPILDLSHLNEAALSFRLAYANTISQEDGLMLLGYAGCKDIEPLVLFEAYGGELATTVNTSNWEPSTDADWRTIDIDLSAFVGNSEVRLVFVAMNDNGNNLYIDDIELFNTSSPIHSVGMNDFKIHPNPSSGNYANVSFQVKEVQDVHIKLINSQGMILLDQVFPQTLNHTYKLNVSALRPGVYFVNAKSNSLNDTKRFVVY